MSAWKVLRQRDDTMDDSDARWLAAVRADLDRRQHGAHLTDETWLALARGVPPPDGVDALSHVARCAECREVLRAVRALREAATDATGPLPATNRRWHLVAAAAAMLAVLGAGWLVRRPSPPAMATTAHSAPPSLASPPASTPADGAASAAPARPDWLRASPPPIALYSPGVLTVRGAGTAAFPDALAEALAPWRAGRYAEAAGRLGALGSIYPEAVEVPFYQGTAWLLSGAPRKAIAPLRAALDAAPPSLRPDAAWYLGVSLLESGQAAAASQAFTEACRAGHARGCDAARFTAAAREGS